MHKCGEWMKKKIYLVPRDAQWYSLHQQHVRGNYGSLLSWWSRTWFASNLTTVSWLGTENINFTHWTCVENGTWAFDVMKNALNIVLLLIFIWMNVILPKKIALCFNDAYWNTNVEECGHCFLFKGNNYFVSQNIICGKKCLGIVVIKIHIVRRLNIKSVCIYWWFQSLPVKEKYLKTFNFFVHVLNVWVYMVYFWILLTNDNLQICCGRNHK